MFEFKEKDAFWNKSIDELKKKYQLFSFLILTTIFIGLVYLTVGLIGIILSNNIASLAIFILGLAFMFLTLFSAYEQGIITTMIFKLRQEEK